MAILSKKLCTIDRYVPLEKSTEEFVKKEYDIPRLTELFINLEFGEFLKSISSSSDKDILQAEFEFVSSDALESLMSDAKGDFVYRLYGKKRIEGFAFKKEDKVYLCLSSGEDDAKKIAASLKPIFENENINKVSCDIKHSITTLSKYGIVFNKSYFDIGIGAYIINPSKSAYSASSVALDLLSVSIPDEKDVLKGGKISICDADKKEVSAFVAGEVCAIEKLKEAEEEKIKKDGQEKLLYDIELPLVCVLADMEITGFKIDKDALEDFTSSLTEKIDALEEKIFALAGESFNINSTKQLGVILFEKLGLKVIKKTKTGYSTDSAVLEKLLGKHEIIENIIEYRRATKLKSTYGDGLLAVINPETGRIHSSFNQTVTTTGRISSTEPNLQNIPMRREEGREIRKMFVPEDSDFILTDADYSQIELRILSHISNDEVMTEAFLNGEDIHASTASKVFGVAMEDVTPLLRTRAKAVNFGIVYGMGEYSLSRDLHISVKEAKDYIASYFEKFKSVKNYLDKTIADAKENGFVTTMFGRRRYIPEIASSNFMTRSFGERVAMNTPIQGSAADIIKIAMVNVHRELKKRNLKSRLILQVHDELIIETKKDEANEVRELLTECMKNAADLKCGLLAETSAGDNWYEAH